MLQLLLLIVALLVLAVATLTAAVFVGERFDTRGTAITAIVAVVVFVVAAESVNHLISTIA